MTIDAVLNDLKNERVSLSLAKALRVAERGGDETFVKWCRLELGGYWASNPAMTEKVAVPEYRNVPGQHSDIYGRVLAVPSDLAFVNETRLRNGIEELETLADSRDTVSIHDPQMCDLLRRHLGVEVYAFRFSVIHLRGVLAAVRRELSDKLHALRPVLNAVKDPPVDPDDDILEVRPNFWGIGVNLRALWRRWKGPETKA